MKNNDTMHAHMAMLLVIEAYDKLYKHMRPITGHISRDLFLLDVVTRGLNDILTTHKPSYPVDEALELHETIENM